jgi:ketosteroid isomerase-like protein
MVKFYRILVFSLSVALSFSCSDDKKEKENARAAIAKAEKDFEKMAAEKGIAEAFWFFAAPDAVMKDTDTSLVKGKDGIRNRFSAERYSKAKVTWTAEFIDVAEDGDMGYTYGPYIWRSTDSTCKINESKGIFHTVWKKQEDGSWKFVWD